jgi:uncharacterized membrane protein
MNKYHILSIICFISGFLLLAISIYQGEGKVYWIVIFPVIEGSGLLSFAGILLIFLGFIMLMVAFVSGSFEWVGMGELGWDDEDDYPRSRSVSGQKTKGDGSTKKARKLDPGTSREAPRDSGYPPTRPRRRGGIRSGGVIFIGPIPIIWGSDKKIGFMMAIVAIILVVIFLIFTMAWMFNGF